MGLTWIGLIGKSSDTRKQEGTRTDDNQARPSKYIIYDISVKT